jgi:hypothetical protein
MSDVLGDRIGSDDPEELPRFAHRCQKSSLSEPTRRRPQSKRPGRAPSMMTAAISKAATRDHVAG